MESKLITREFMRTYEIQRVQSCLDGLIFAWLLHLLTVDVFPTEIFVPLFLLFFLWRTEGYESKYKLVEQAQLRKLRKIFRVGSWNKFAMATSENNSSRAENLIFSNWIILSPYRYEQNNLGLIAHEVTHIRRHDSLINGAYRFITFYYLFTAIGNPVFWLIFGVPDEIRNDPNFGLGMFLLVFVTLVLPGVIFYFMGRRYNYRRECIADSEALIAFPDAYLREMNRAKTLDRMSHSAARGSRRDQHPSIQNRTNLLTGEKRIPRISLIATMLGVSMLTVLLSRNAAAGFIYVPDNNLDAPQISMLRFALNAAILVYAIFLLSKISAIVTCGYKSGLQPIEKAVCSLLFLATVLPGMFIVASSVHAAFRFYFEDLFLAFLVPFSVLAIPLLSMPINFLVTFVLKKPVAVTCLVILTYLAPTAFLLAVGPALQAKWIDSQFELISASVVFVFVIALVVFLLTRIGRGVATHGQRRLAVRTILGISLKHFP